MKKGLLLSALALLFLQGGAKLQAYDFLTEVKAAYFNPSNDEFRHIYGNNGGGLYGLEMNGQVWRSFYGWLSADYFQKKGKSLGEGDPTRVTLVPIGFGLKYFLPIKSVDLYFGGGGVATYLHLTDDSPYVVKHHAKWGIGGIIKAGALYTFKNHFFIDLFYDYTFLGMNFSDKSDKNLVMNRAHLSGWSAGAGIGYRFGSGKK